MLRSVAERLGNLVHGEDTSRAWAATTSCCCRRSARKDPAARPPPQRSLGVLARPFTVQGKTLNVAATIGISIYPNDGRDFVELLKNADAALTTQGDGQGRRMFAPALNARAPSGCAWRTSCALRSRAASSRCTGSRWCAAGRRPSSPLHWRGHRRRRGAGALAAPARPARPRALRSPRRGVRHDPRDRRMGARARAVAGGRVAAPLRAASGTRSTCRRRALRRAQSTCSGWSMR